MAGRLRITSGLLVRRLFKTPPLADKGLVRPCTDRVRQAIFSALGVRLHQAQVLDLFAGSGAYAFESLSRGAQTAVLIEKSKDTAQCILENIQSLGLDDLCQLKIKDAYQYIKTEKRSFDLIFLDPPYTLLLEPSFFEELYALSHTETILVYRSFYKVPLPSPIPFEVIRDQTYGNMRVWFLRPLPLCLPRPPSNL